MKAAERAHYDYVASRPCLACGSRPVELHHVTAYADRPGRLSRRNDRVVPLCARHHRCGAIGGNRDSVEALSHRGFFTRYGIDLMAEAERLWNESQEKRNAA